MKNLDKNKINKDIGNMNEKKVKNLMDREKAGREKAAKFENSSLPKLNILARRVKLFFSLLRASMTGRYPLQWHAIAAIAFALLYFLNPIDLIPDVLFPVGYLDDAAVLALVFNMLKNVLCEYMHAVGLDPDDYFTDDDEEGEIITIG
jgi:uncharacterized membrane protein YkvA (DUF1232 family)